MNTLSKIMLGSIGGTIALASAAMPAQAQWGRYDHHRGSNRAVNACVMEAQRFSRGGRVRVQDVDRRGGNRFRVRGIVDTRFGGYHRSRWGERRFTCTAAGWGRVTNFKFNGRRW